MGSKFFVRKRGIDVKRGLDVEMGGVATFLFLYSSITFTLYVGKVKFPLLLFFFGLLS